MSNPIHSWFLGPKGENESLLKELLDSALQTHLRWRRAYHPEDSSPIAAGRARAPGTAETLELKRHFASLLEQLQRSVPFFSGRYNGHMLSEQTIAGQAAYFAAMLYNPNNVSSEVAPVTTRLEGEVANQLAEMIGYDPVRCWGHLTSGGTIANFEALWIARNVHYHPVGARLAARALGIDISVSLPDGTRASLSELDLWHLLNIRPSCSLDLWEKLWLAAPGPVIESALKTHSLATLGYQDYSRQLAAEFGDPLPAGVVLAAGTSHYSWAKIVAALGVGSNQLLFVPVDAECRMAPEALWREIVALTEKRIPIMACVSACGTTEEGAIDDLQQILEVRARAEWELGVTFHVHSDACYGGYAASVTRAPDGSRHTAAHVREQCGGANWPSDQWVRSVAALASADSVSIDPHKLGYVPYPAGAFLLKDKRGRELVATDPPYLALPTPLEGAPPHVIGRFIFEGSKPGASAAAVWLSHRAIPLNSEGHGRIIVSTLKAARELHALLGSSDFSPFRAIRLPEPDLNIVCFLLHHPSLDSVAAINSLNEMIYRELSPDAEMSAPYMITRTRLTSPMYDGAIKPLLSSLGMDGESYRENIAGGLTVLRATVMNPFSLDANPDYLAGLIDALREVAMSFLRDPSASEGSYSASSPIFSAKST
ncbi:MAG TPA: pyridoxal-dependent decarboxylase [Gemmatimonadaceae bacterium]|nr:pyridoxal-dependent decarboxylase [Gemmatimonadaceae bacterium]